MAGATGAERGNPPVNVKRNAFGTYGARGVLALSTLLVTPYLYRSLGPASFGTWSVILSLTGVVSLFEFGFASGPIKYVAELRARGERAELQATLSSAVGLMAGLGVVALAVSVAAAFLLDSLAASGDRDAFRYGIIALGLAELVRFPCAAYMGALEGFQRYDLSNGAWVGSTVLFAVGAVVAVAAGTGVLGVAIAYAVVSAGTGVAFAVMLKRIEPELSLLPRVGERTTRRRLLRFSSFALLLDSMVFVGQRMDVVVIAAIRNAAQAAPFAAALKLQSGLQSLILPFVNMLMPMVSDLSARGRQDEVMRRFKIATRIAVQMAIPVAFGLALFARDAVRLWLGPRAQSATVSIVVVLMAVQVLTLSAAPAEKVLLGLGRVRLPAALSVIEGVSNLCVSAVLVWRLGAIGAAYGTLLTSALLAPVKFPLVCRALGYSTVRFVAETIGRSVLVSTPAVGTMVAVFFLLPGGVLRLVVGLLLGCAVAILAAVIEVGARRVAALVLGRGADSGFPRAADLEPPVTGIM
jgi:O-antigen/teichoic acid export membrane protein